MDIIFLKCIFLNETVWISISLKCVPEVPINTLRPRQNGRHFADDIFDCIFLNENVWIPIKISLKFVPHGPISNIPALVQIMAWRRPGDKPSSGTMMVRLPTHICVTRPQWVNNIPALVQIMTWCRQGIIWTNDGLIYWRIYASPNLNEWKFFMHLPGDNGLTHCGPVMPHGDRDLSQLCQVMAPSHYLEWVNQC